MAESLHPSLRALWPAFAAVFWISLIGSLWVTSPAIGQEGKPSGRPPTDAAPSDPAKRARLSAGEITLLDFLRLVREHTGQLILVESSGDGRDVLSMTTLTVLEDVDPFTFAVAEAILTLNGLPLREQTLEDGLRVFQLDVDPQRKRGVGETPILTGAPGLRTLPGLEVATLVRPLQHADPQDVVTVLRDLLDADASAPGAPKFVAVPTSRQVIVRAPVRLLTHTIALLDHVDVPRRTHEKTLRIHELEHTAALDLVDLLEQALAEFRERRGGVGARPTRAGTTESGGTRLIPDPRTQKILVQGDDPRALALVDRLVAELDVPYQPGRHFRVYAVKYHRASKLAETLQAWLQGSELDQRFTVVAHDPSNTILIRGTDPRDGGVLNFLFALDRPEPVGKPVTKRQADATLEGYRPEHRTPAELIEGLLARFGETPGFKVLPYAPSASVLVRVPADQLEAVRSALRSLDQPK